MANTVMNARYRRDRTRHFDRSIYRYLLSIDEQSKLLTIEADATTAFDFSGKIADSDVVVLKLKNHETKFELRSKIERIYRFLKPNGYVCVSFEDNFTYKQTTDFKNISFINRYILYRKSLKLLEEIGFSDIEPFCTIRRPAKQNFVFPIKDRNAFKFYIKKLCGQTIKVRTVDFFTNSNFCFDVLKIYLPNITIRACKNVK